MTIRFDPNAETWYYRFSRDKRSFFKGGFRTKKQAEDAQGRDFDKVIRGEIHPERAGQEMTFREAGQWFLDNHALARKRSWKNDRGRIKGIAEFFQDKRLSRITPMDVMALREHLKELGLSTHTVNHYQVQLKLVLNRLKKMGRYAGENPACLVELERIPRARVRFLYPAEERSLTPEVSRDARLWPYYFTALHTGMRIQEICNVWVEHVTLVTNSLFVPHSKTNRSRHVPLSSELARFLEARMEGKKPEDFVLGGFSSQLVSRMFKKACRVVGVEDFKFHDLRHTFTQRLLSQGVPIYKVSKILGHSSVVVTEQHYGHLSMTDLKSAVDQIDGVISSPMPGCSQVAVNAVMETEEFHKTF